MPLRPGYVFGCQRCLGNQFNPLTWRDRRQSIYSQPMREDASPPKADSNQLEQASSSYLRSARHQPVESHPWGEARFARAQAENKPILLDIGAVWCHWCHVVDREAYEDPAMAAIINQNFLPVLDTPAPPPPTPPPPHPPPSPSTRPPPL